MTLSDAIRNADQDIISLRLGDPDPTTLVTAELRAALQMTISSSDLYRGLQYGPDEGTSSLINYLIKKIDREQGTLIGLGNIMLVAGATQAIDLLARLYAGSGGMVLIEAPTHKDAIRIFQDHNIELYSIPLDEDGLITSELEKQLRWLKSNNKRPSFLYTIPTFHNLTGILLSDSRRLEIIKLAQQYSFMIVEDDVYRDLPFNIIAPASFYTLAYGKQVCSIGSFSKTLAPGLRLGWMVAPEDVIQRCVNCGTTQMGGGASPFSAHLIAEYCQSGHWEKHILHLQSLYRTRRDFMLSVLKRYMPSDVEWTYPKGGFFVWVRLPQMCLLNMWNKLHCKQVYL